MSVLARHRTTVMIVAVALLAVVLTAWWGRDDRTYAGSLDPQNPGGDGAQALARVLDEQGVSVDVVRSADAFDRATTDSSTMVVVSAADRLGRSTTRRLLDHQGDAGLVVVTPGPELTALLDIGSYAVTTSPHRPVPAGCTSYDGLALQVPEAEAFDTDGCFRARGGVLLAEPRPGLTLLGASAALTNDQILDGDNAAVALRLLGQRPHLVWYVPSLTDLVGRDGVSPSSLLPRWLTPALWLVLMTSVGLVVWRSRRLGPLAVEPLPVEVKAVETTRNLGRLYRRAGDRGHAAEALRSAARARLTERLRLPRHTEHAVLAAAVAAHAGRNVDEVDALLSPDAVPPAHDHDLADLARRLDELDREVSRA
jgi:hypothetical protein